MYKIDFQYTDLDGNVDVQTLHFNLTKVEVTEDPEFIRELALWGIRLQNVEKMPLDEQERFALFRFFARFVGKAYGLRDAVNRTFTKVLPDGRPVVDLFREQDVYGPFMESLFDGDMAGAQKMFEGLLPAEAAEDLRKEMSAVVQEAAALANSPEEVELPLDIPTPVWISEDREPTAEEMKAMTREQLIEVYRRRSEKS